MIPNYLLDLVLCPSKYAIKSIMHGTIPWLKASIINGDI